MKSLRSRLPSPNALIAFEATARHLSFTIAAKELNVTRAAASSQVKQLENRLGVKLFDRIHRSLRLTPAGEVLARRISQSLEDIASTAEAIAAPESEGQLTVTSSPSVMAYWLLPRINEFLDSHPDVQFRYLVTEEYVNLIAAGVDVGIRYGDGDWESTTSTKLAEVEHFPICSPKYIGDRYLQSDPHALLNEHLLHLVAPYETQMRWSTWFHSQGIETEPLVRGSFYDNHHSLVQAVLQGQGIALLGLPLLSSQLASGELVRPIECPSTFHRDMWLVEPMGAKRTQISEAFCRWIFDHMAA